MSDDIRSLIGRYATGELTEAERKLLFEAALEDQTLFDELAGEHALKQLLERPGVKQRLIGSLSPARRKTAWPWRWISASMATAAAVLVVALLLRPPAARQIAEVQMSAPLPARPPSAASLPPENGPRSAKASPKTQPKAAPAPELAATDAAQEPAITASEKAIPNAVEVQPPVPSPQSPRVLAPRAATAFRAETQGALVQRFAFNYEVTADRKLRITPASNGFISVRAVEGASSEVLTGNQAARPGMTSEFDVPASATLVTVTFSAQPAPQEAVPATMGGALDPPSGSKADPNPTAESRLTAVIPLASK